jgi:serine/threonine protein kinase
MGKYLLLERLATGGMAEVYRAKSTGASGFEKHLAIKRILPDHLEDDTFRRMFETEARIGSSLQHSNIVQILDFVKFGETFLLVMEFVNGKNLRQVVNKLKKLQYTLPIECTLFIINETCKGLDYAHSKKDDFTGQPQNIIHRDMSPQNIMLSYDGSVKIVDFGIANWKDKLEQTKSGVIKGKFGYMSPEQAAGEPITHLTDLFSTGIIFWELLTGKRLFTAESDLSTLRLIQDCVVPRPSQFNPKVTPDLERIVMKALSKNSAQRYPSAGSMQRQIQEHLNKHYPGFRENELANMMQRLFKEEITTEKKRFEILTRQSVPFSQGNSEATDSSANEFEIDNSIAEGSITGSDQDRVSHATFIDQDSAPSAVVRVHDGDSKTKETHPPLESKSQSTAKNTLSETNPEGDADVPETIAKTIVARPLIPPAISTSKVTPTKSSTLQQIVEKRVEPKKTDEAKEVSFVINQGGIRLDTNSITNQGISRDAWGSNTSEVIAPESQTSIKLSAAIRTAEEELPPGRISGVAKVVAASGLIAVTAYLYQLLLSGQNIIPVKIETQDPRLIGSCDPTKNPACSKKSAKPSVPTSVNSQVINNCELRFESDPPGAMVLIDGVEKLATPGTALVPCDTSINYSVRLKDHETVAENVFVKSKMKPISRTLKKVELGDLVVVTNRRVKIFSDTDQFGETEPGKPFRIERLPANRTYNIHFVNEIFGIDDTRPLEVKPGVSNLYEIRLDEKPEKR